MTNTVLLSEKRDRNHPSDKTSWYNVYYQSYKHLPSDKPVNLKDILNVLLKWEKGSKSYKDAVSVMKKLAGTAKRKDILEELKDINSKQTEFREKQSISLEDFLKWRDKALGLTEELPIRANLETRKQWICVLSMCIQYGLRISEVFAIKNLYGRYANQSMELHLKHLLLIN